VKAALVVHQGTVGLEASLAAMEAEAAQAAGEGAGLVLFPEAALTGMVNNDDPAHDLPLGTPIPGPATDRLAAIARRHGLWLATGLPELEGRCLYDSAVLTGPDGGIALHYRRVQPQWHGRNADPAVYRQGEEVVACEAPFGRCAFLICGDLFDDGIVEQARRQCPGLVLFPFARNFGDGSFDQARWDREEEALYVARAARLGCTVLMVNALGDPTRDPWPSFGGAMAVAPGGEVMARKPLGEPGMVFIDLP